MVKVRFAPSPTGHLHIGGARTALFNYLFAKKHNGKFLVRIEDTDLVRSSVESERVIINDLKWLGINWDEGIDAGGENGPYRSTERREIYKKYVDKLLEEDKAYYCYCTQEELEEERKRLEEANSDMLGYSGKCSNLTEEQIKKYEAEGRKPTIRLRVPKDQIIEIDDIVRGHVEFDSNGVGDFIIVKSDGIPVYNFAVVVDDYLMGITHVIRAEEHLSNTPRQILIYDALGFKKPQFAHVSLILGHDRTKMSKRHGATWVEQYRDLGYLPEAIVNFLALMGWSPETEEEFFTIDELISQFSLERVSKNPAVFDNEKLNWMNSQYIKNASLERITDMAIPHLKKAGFIGEEVDGETYEWIKKMVKAVKHSLDYVAQITEKVKIFFNDEISPENDETLEVLKGEQVPQLMDALISKVNEADVIDEEFGKSVFKTIGKETGIKGKNLFMPIRVMLTGQMHGPELYDIISVLGKEKIIKRINWIRENYL
ncbi:MAG TPA: glutamate--tRNA ligase [Ruminiclostridium sp.]|jgi:nondiscriminating glutamyl-tRNA synthetase|uniref:Glutamate--tRNA ligase n=1 Tax=Acetivibrio saccincola TaxID=1677857 RepID=A0A2K9E5Q4_9FIRM|nr:glutamate--tRNA ligase [Acetivibrio saccincola]HAA43001.1 glutamate--tRNA ligase [Ruminiclostridium sp.]AUG59037.1 Glutamate--tRNA ligase [Acetivibrio saccincola]NLW27453.1 glutamate--tRNA ligase [Acetivibrio saccincola]PQQ65882.1 glutamate--tRNA ligase [Acetivibrio saccincola]HOA97126.1 glutamate--tRNA ligase [Acetivibrio saccincola]